MFHKTRLLKFAYNFTLRINFYSFLRPAPGLFFFNWENVLLERKPLRPPFQVFHKSLIHTSHGLHFLDLRSWAGVLYRDYWVFFCYYFHNNGFAHHLDQYLCSVLRLSEKDDTGLMDIISKPIHFHIRNRWQCCGRVLFPIICIIF